MAKSYQDATDKERYDSAEKMKKEKYDVVDTLKRLVTPKKVTVPPTPPAGLPEDKKMAKGGMVKSSASKRADGCAQRGKTRGRVI